MRRQYVGDRVDFHLFRIVAILRLHWSYSLLTSGTKEEAACLWKGTFWVTGIWTISKGPTPLDQTSNQPQYAFIVFVVNNEDQIYCPSRRCQSFSVDVICRWLCWHIIPCIIFCRQHVLDLRRMHSEMLEKASTVVCCNVYNLCLIFHVFYFFYR